MDTLKYFYSSLEGPFIDLPCFIPLEEYDKTVDFLISCWTKLKYRPIAIYQIGEVKSPGFSDLDFIIVLPKDGFVNVFKFDPIYFPDSIKILLTHMPYFCTEDSWDFLFGWFPISNLRWLWGEMLDYPMVLPSYRKGNAFGMLIDYLIVKIPIDLLYLLFNKPVRLRVLVSTLYSLKYTFRLASDSGIKLPTECSYLVSKIESLRDKWWERNLRENIVELIILCARAYDVVSRLILEVNRAIGYSCDFDLMVGRGLFEFSSVWKADIVLKKVYKSIVSGEDIRWISPISFREVLLFYAKVCPQFIGFFKKYSFYEDSVWDGGEWSEGLAYHAKSMFYYSKCASRLGVPPLKYISLGYMCDLGRDKLSRFLSAYLNFLLVTDISVDEFGEFLIGLKNEFK